ncbi:hypothetical protein GSI_12125 [Ganoderma sinense ZZ0214-1]|uniref:NADAR domain-containing protein n=1 Tax=Ganoderma sinense ZZ0214-1 TaxID=1077348 RepID=A0A2G8RXX1_9APHY|nr:hypothetical protein GSI_12125 [Ganoderma sinense ZZ0214-1]
MTKTPDDFVFFWKPDGSNGWAGQWHPSPFTARVALPPSQGNGDVEAAEGEERDVYFPTAEHWMMAQKALLFGDREIFERVVGLPSSSFTSTSTSSGDTPSAAGPGPTRSTRSRPSKATAPTTPKGTRSLPSPKEVKALGRKVKNFDDETWVRERTRIVLEGSLHKFRQNANLRRELLATGEKELVEASPLDGIWGIGMGEKKGRETCGSDALGRQGWGLNLLGKALVQARAILREEFKDEAEGQVANGGDEETS